MAFHINRVPVGTNYLVQKAYIVKITLLIFCIIFTSVVGADDKPTINFAPLPTREATNNIKEFLSMTYYLENKLSIDFNYIYKNDYNDILAGFENQSIDLAYLGPLPLITLINKYPYVEPLVAFKNKNGTSRYRCVLAKFKNDSFDIDKPIKVALTQPLSTCGYYMTSILLQDKFGIDLKQQQYHYTMSHTNALLAVLQGEFLIAGAKDSIAGQFESLGMEIIAQSGELPGFSLVANKKTLSAKQIEAIRSSLLSIPQETIKSWEGFMSHGMTKASIKDYATFNINFDIPQQGNIK